MAIIERGYQYTLFIPLLTALSAPASAQHAAPNINTAEDLDQVVRKTFANAPSHG